jgi:hypothetical protein
MYILRGSFPIKVKHLIVKLPGWKLPGIVKEKVYFVPLKEKEMFWVGSYYQPCQMIHILRKRDAQIFFRPFLKSTR